VIEILNFYKVPIAGRNAVVIGRSDIVGKPAALLLLAEDATVTIVHSKTRDLKKICQAADILIVAMGKPKFIGPDYVSPGAVVIDVGIHRVDDKIVGDVDYEKVAPIVQAITPVPGGVGKMTIAMLMKNVVMAARLQVSTK
jgi:methylenetetrahydrofolate dehydrogenase (NADP+)/methenyltetrahydrofolate cyclohydrolase